MRFVYCLYILNPSEIKFFISVWALPYIWEGASKNNKRTTSLLSVQSSLEMILACLIVWREKFRPYNMLHQSCDPLPCLTVLFIWHVAASSFWPNVLFPHNASFIGPTWPLSKPSHALSHPADTMSHPSDTMSHPFNVISYPSSTLSYLVMVINHKPYYYHGILWNKLYPSSQIYTRNIYHNIPNVYISGWPLLLLVTGHVMRISAHIWCCQVNHTVQHLCHCPIEL